MRHREARGLVLGLRAQMWGGGDLTLGNLLPESMPVNFAPTYWPGNRPNRSGSGSNLLGWPRVLVFPGPRGFWGAGEGLSGLRLSHPRVGTLPPAWCSLPTGLGPPPPPAFTPQSPVKTLGLGGGVTSGNRLEFRGHAMIDSKRRD